MAQTSSEQLRAWQGPAIFSFGFRPFFLFGAVWVVVAMVLWLASMAGLIALPTRFDPVSWHAHEFLFGYLGAILAGFLLTAVPNWTGRLPLLGWPLAALFALWVTGRAAVLFSDHIPFLATIIVDLAFPIVLGAMILQEIIAGKNWRNLIVLALLSVFTLANALFHVEAMQGGNAAQGMGLRLGVATALMMIASLAAGSFRRLPATGWRAPILPHDPRRQCSGLTSWCCWQACPSLRGGCYILSPRSPV